MGVIELGISGLGASGDGMAETPAGKFYVPLTAPGDRVRAEELSMRGDAHLCRATEILEASPARRVPPCPHFAAIGKAGCGGCSLQHLDEKTYRAFKLSVVETALRHAKAEPKEWAEPSWTGEGQRRRAVFAARHMGRAVAIGFNEAASPNICDLATCLILDPRIMALLPGLRAVLPEVMKQGEKLDVQVSLVGGALDVVLVRKESFSPLAVSAFAGFMEDRKIARLSWRQDANAAPETLLLRQTPEAVFGGHAVRVPAGGFMQASDKGEAALVAAVLEGLEGVDFAADLFCGSGTFALPMAALGMKVVAADSDAPAVDALAECVRRDVLGGKLQTAKRNLMRQPMMASELEGFSGVALDPPRVGAVSQVAEIVKARVPRVVAVSCNPATFARDASALLSGGYVLQKVWPVDQFLYSPHMELAALFVRG